MVRAYVIQSIAPVGQKLDPRIAGKPMHFCRRRRNFIGKRDVMTRQSNCWYTGLQTAKKYLAFSNRASNSGDVDATSARRDFVVKDRFGPAVIGKPDHRICMESAIHLVVMNLDIRIPPVDELCKIGKRESPQLQRRQQTIAVYQRTDLDNYSIDTHIIVRRLLHEFCDIFLPVVFPAEFRRRIGNSVQFFAPLLNFATKHLFLPRRIIRLDMSRHLDALFPMADCRFMQTAPANGCYDVGGTTCGTCLFPRFRFVFLWFHLEHRWRRLCRLPGRWYVCSRLIGLHPIETIRLW
jgi:hypothetical protein